MGSKQNYQILIIKDFVFRLDARCGKLVWNIGATYLFHDLSIKSSMNKAFLQHEWMMTWEKSGGLCFTHYAMYGAPNHNTIFFAKWGNHMH